jgi:hypothetical protein
VEKHRDDRAHDLQHEKTITPVTDGHLGQVRVPQCQSCRCQ